LDSSVSIVTVLQAGQPRISFQQG